MKMDREIKFDIVARNIHFNEIVHTILTLEQIWEGREIPSWLKSDNCEMLAKRRWTGLKDKNGVEIYEGDIIKTSYHKHEVVMGWGEDNEQYAQSYGWCLKDLDEEGSEYREANPRQIVGYRPEDYNEDWEAIGNIYENKDLLEPPHA